MPDTKRTSRTGMTTEEVEALAGAVTRAQSSGQTQVGWKLGFGSDQGKALLGISRPLVGALFDGGRAEVGSTLDVSGLVNPMVEPEIAAWMRSDVPEDAEPDEVVAAVGALVPAVELADLRFAPENTREVLAGNIYHERWLALVSDGAGWGAGPERRVTVTFGDQSWQQDVPESMTGSLIEGLQQCAVVAHALGRGLLRGDVVFLGSVIPPQKVKNARFTVTFDDGRSALTDFVGASE
jgi:2-keto-4-pentenoate hydratase